MVGRYHVGRDDYVEHWNVHNNLEVVDHSQNKVHGSFDSDVHD